MDAPAPVKRSQVYREVMRSLGPTATLEGFRAAAAEALHVDQAMIADQTFHDYRKRIFGLKRHKSPNHRRGVIENFLSEEWVREATGFGEAERMDRLHKLIVFYGAVQLAGGIARARRMLDVLDLLGGTDH